MCGAQGGEVTDWGLWGGVGCGKASVAVQHLVLISLPALKEVMEANRMLPHWLEDKTDGLAQGHSPSLLQWAVAQVRACLLL